MRGAWSVGLLGGPAGGIISRRLEPRLRIVWDLFPKRVCEERMDLVYLSRKYQIAKEKVVVWGVGASYAER